MKYSDFTDFFELGLFFTALSSLLSPLSALLPIYYYKDVTTHGLIYESAFVHLDKRKDR